MTESARRAVEDQWRAFLRAMASVSGPTWVSVPAAITAAENKALQLARAREAGLAVPETLWTNSLDEARAFIDRFSGHAVVKSVTSAWWEQEDRGWFVFARLVRADELPTAERLAVAPVLLQQPVTPKRDVRVTVVGKRAFAAVREPPSAEDDELDWRRGSDAPWRLYDLPYAVASACVELVGSFGLRFSAIDLAIDESGAHWFLESNPNGEWAWLQRAGLPIAEALADELMT
ncbi:MAG: hypothetical protein ACREON_20425 [Gemmatimonadaceae bacterium]